MGSMSEVTTAIEEAKKAFKPKASIGENYLEKGATHRTYEINMTYFDPFRWSHWKPEKTGEAVWGGQIHVYGNEALRDKIVRLLNENPD